MSDLASPETYARERRGSHARASAHRESRTVRVGPLVVLMFEDRSTIRHQLQEFIRIEQLSEPALIQAEIDSYSALIPDGRNLKASFMLEFADSAERRALGPTLRGIERSVWMCVEGSVRIPASVRDEPRAAGRAAHLLHRLVFDLNDRDVNDLRGGAALSIGIEHAAYNAAVLLDETQRVLLLADLH